MKSKSIYYVCKQDGQYYSERRAIVYQNDKFTYIKRPGSKVLTYISTDSIHYDFNPNNVEEGYYLKKPNKGVFNKLTVYEAINECRKRLTNFYESRERISNELSHLNACIERDEILLSNLLLVDKGLDNYNTEDDVNVI